MHLPFVVSFLGVRVLEGERERVHMGERERERERERGRTFFNQDLKFAEKYFDLSS